MSSPFQSAAAMPRLAAVACLPLLLLATAPAHADAPAAASDSAKTTLTEPATDPRAALAPEPGEDHAGRVLTVFFAFDEAALTTESRRALDRLAPRLRDHLAAGGAVLVGGHADATGDADYNLALSERRTRAVAAFLRDAWGIAPQRLSLRAWGESNLRRPGTPRHAENRRVEITLLPPRQARKRGAELRPRAEVALGGRHLDIDDFGGAISPLPLRGDRAGRVITMPAPRH